MNTLILENHNLLIVVKITDNQVTKLIHTGLVKKRDVISKKVREF